MEPIRWEGASSVEPAPLESHELNLPSSLEGLPDLEQLTEQLAKNAGFDEDISSNIAMVTREAAINAVKHGNSFDPGKRVRARLQRTADKLTIAIADQGAGMDPNALPDPLDPANLLRASGRGVFLMRAIMDEIGFRDLQPGTEVVLVKHIRPS